MNWVYQVEVNEKTKFYKILRYRIRRLAYNFQLLKVLQSISKEKYDEKISASIVFGFWLFNMNFFFSLWREALLW